VLTCCGSWERCWGLPRLRPGHPSCASLFGAFAVVVAALLALPALWGAIVAEGPSDHIGRTRDLPAEFEDIGEFGKGGQRCCLLLRRVLRLLLQCRCFPPCRRRSVLDALWVRRAGSYAGRSRVLLLMGSGLSL
jgi:hypothetical protein